MRSVARPAATSTASGTRGITLWEANLTPGGEVYEINLDALCEFQNFAPEQVVSADLVFPKGAVPNAQILWVRLELTNEERKFITLPLADFYRFVTLPESSIGGWTDGDRGHDRAGHFARYALDDSGDSSEAPGELQHSAEGVEEAVEA